MRVNLMIEIMMQNYENLITNPYPVQHVAKYLVIALAMVLFQDYRLEFWPKGVYHVPGKSLLSCLYSEQGR